MGLVWYFITPLSVMYGAVSWLFYCFFLGGGGNWPIMICIEPILSNHNHNRGAIYFWLYAMHTITILTQPSKHDALKQWFLLLAQRLWRLLNIKTALFQSVVFAGNMPDPGVGTFPANKRHCACVGPMLSQDWSNTGPMSLGLLGCQLHSALSFPNIWFFFGFKKNQLHFNS